MMSSPVTVLDLLFQDKKGGEIMDQKTIWGCCVIMGWVVIGAILVAKMPNDAASDAFAHWANASSRGLALAQPGSY